MAIERARVLAWPKPWGVADLSPWRNEDHEEHCSRMIGELSYERANDNAPATALLLKLLFTSAPLSIQVHPDDVYAKSIGLPNGKSEAWYVLNAAPGAKVALGLNKLVTRNQLRQAVHDGSIAHIVRWQGVEAHDAIVVPAGTIHAIGAGVVIAEIQQRSDATFRLFDHGSERVLHLADGTAAADLGPSECQARPKPLSGERMLLASNAHFVFERVSLRAASTWCLDAARETWLLVLSGLANAGSLDLVCGDAVFAQAECITIQVGGDGMECLVAYTGGYGPDLRLLERVALRPGKDQAPTIPIGVGL